MDRRQALTMFGAAGVGAVVFGACGSSGRSDGAQPGTTSAGGPTSTNGSAGSATTAASAAAGALSASSFEDAASCTVTPRQTEGPYYIDVDQIRSDIREDRQGVPLRVGARVMNADGCTPVKDAVFEIWHCDAGGLGRPHHPAVLRRHPQRPHLRANPPYSAKTGRRTLNSQDGIYRSETTLTVSPDGDGYLGLITIGVSA